MRRRSALLWQRQLRNPCWVAGVPISVIVLVQRPEPGRHSRKITVEMRGYEIHVAAMCTIDGVARLVELPQPVQPGQSAGGAGVGDLPTATIGCAQGRYTVVIGAGCVSWRDVGATSVGRVVWFVESQEMCRAFRKVRDLP